MKFLSILVAAAATLASVRSQDQSLCDKYTTALLKENNSTNQLTVLTLVVNTALIGNYSNATGPAKNAVTGILNPGTYNGTQVSLLKYFDGSLKSTNRNGQAVSLSFLDGGGAAPLKENLPAAANATSSNQYMLVTHLYEFFGVLLGCSMQNSSSAFKNYQGNPSMSQVHRYMNLNQTQNAYFIQEVGLAATSFGVSADDAMTIGNSLTKLFNYRCSPPMSVGENLPAASQSVCLASSCPLDANSNCTQTDTSFGNGTEGAMPAQGSTSGSSGSSGSGSGSKDDSTSVVGNVLGALALAVAGALAVTL